MILTQTLTAEEFVRLGQCYEFLTQVTAAHGNNCRCPLCHARTWCGPVDAESRTVQYVSHEE